MKRWTCAQESCPASMTGSDLFRYWQWLKPGPHIILQLWQQDRIRPLESMPLKSVSDNLVDFIGNVRLLLTQGGLHVPVNFGFVIKLVVWLLVGMSFTDSYGKYIFQWNIVSPFQFRSVAIVWKKTTIRRCILSYSLEQTVEPIWTAIEEQWQMALVSNCKTQCNSAKLMNFWFTQPTQSCANQICTKPEFQGFRKALSVSMPINVL